MTAAIRNRGGRRRLATSILAGLFIGLAVAMPASAQGLDAEVAWVKSYTRIIDDPATPPEERRINLEQLRNIFCSFGPPFWGYAAAFKSVKDLQQDPELGPRATQFLGELRIGLSSIIPNPEKRRLLAKTDCRSAIPFPPQDAAGRRTWVIARVRVLDDPATSSDYRFMTLQTLRESYCWLSPLFQSYAPALKTVNGLRKARHLSGIAALFIEELRIGLDPSKTDAEKQTLLAKTGCVAELSQ